MQHFTDLAYCGGDACTSCESRQLGLCGLLEESHLVRLRTRTYRTKYAANSELLAQGEPPEKVGVVAKGWVRVVLIAEDGDHRTVELLSPGQVVGDPFSPQNAFSFEAATSAEVCWIQTKTFHSIMLDQPEVQYAFLATIAAQLEANRFWVAAMHRRRTVERVAFLLLQQGIDQDSDCDPIVHVKLARRDLASLLDMSVETLCRALHQLADQDAIEIIAPDRFRLADMKKLRRHAKSDHEPVLDTLGCADPALGKRNPFSICEGATYKIRPEAERAAAR